MTRGLSEYSVIFKTCNIGDSIPTVWLQTYMFWTMDVSSLRQNTAIYRGLAHWIRGTGRLLASFNANSVVSTQKTIASGSSPGAAYTARVTAKGVVQERKKRKTSYVHSWSFLRSNFSSWCKPANSAYCNDQGANFVCTVYVFRVEWKNFVYRRHNWPLLREMWISAKKSN